MKKKVLIAAAWPYANGSLHLGHVAALLGADILARYFRLKGDEVLYVSGSDCHGTPIVLEAEKQGLRAEEIANKYHQEFVATLVKGLQFSYDNYSSTLTKNHEQVVQEIFLDLYKKGLIYTKIEQLAYCQQCERFLPDRYIEGECPECHFSSARGDQCDHCGRLMDVKTLINPRCKICHKQPIFKDSEHFFLKLSAFQDRLEKWIEVSQFWRVNAKNFSLEFVKQGLLDRAITRDTKWGIPIPLSGYEDKRIYVWFEAVCGYLSASQEWAQREGRANAWEDFWLDTNQEEEQLHYYIHGKDNIPFHAIIWPAILMGLEGFHLPDRIISSEYLTLEKKQFSKSRDWAIWLPDFLAKLPADTLRYYLSANGPESSDADFSWAEFTAKINNELIGTFGNYINRVLSLVNKNFPEGLTLPKQLSPSAKALLKGAQGSFSVVGHSIELGRFREAIYGIFKLADKGNQFLNQTAPWQEIKTNPQQAGADLAVASQIIKALTILIEPFLPESALEIRQQTGYQELSKWEYPNENPLDIKNPKPIYSKIEKEEFNNEK